MITAQQIAHVRPAWHVLALLLAAFVGSAHAGTPLQPALQNDGGGDLAGLVNLPFYGYWATPAYTRSVDHGNFVTVNADRRDILRALTLGQKFHVYEPLNPFDAQARNRIQDIKDTLDSIPYLDYDDVICIRLSQDIQETIGVPGLGSTYGWWETNVLAYARQVFGPDVKLALDFSDSNNTAVPAGADIYSFEWYSIGWQDFTQTQVDSAADAFFNPRRQWILSANGESRDIWITPRGYYTMGSELDVEFPGQLADWADRQGDVTGIHYWDYPIFIADNWGVMDMPGYRAAIRAVADARGDTYDPPRNLLDNSDFEYADLRSAGNLLDNGGFEAFGVPDAAWADGWFDRKLSPVDPPGPTLVSDAAEAYEGSNSLFYSWTQGGFMNSSIGPRTVRPVSGGATYRIGTRFRRAPQDQGSIARMAMEVRWRIFGSEAGRDDAAFDHASLDWEQEAMEVEAPWWADDAVITFFTRHFEIASGADPDAIGYWDDASLHVIDPLTGTILEEDAGPYPDYWTRSGNAATYVQDPAATHLGNACLKSVGLPPPPPPGLQRTFFDDFSGDLSQWNTNVLGGGSVSVVNGHLVVDADASDPRGMLLTDFSTRSASDLSSLVGHGEVYMRISFDVVSGSTHGGELLVGAVPGAGADDIAGTHTLSPLADPAGGGRAHAHGKFPGSVDFGPVNSGLNATSTQSPIGKKVRLDWISKLAGESQTTRRVEVYYDDVLEMTFDEPVDANRLEFNAGPVGFYVLLNRDFTVDNFEVFEFGPYIPGPGELRDTDPIQQGAVFTELSARGKFVNPQPADYTFSVYWKTAPEDPDGLARIKLRIRAKQLSNFLETADVSQTFDVTGAAWQRFALTTTLPARTHYAWVSMEAVGNEAGDGESVGYFDSAQFEAGSSATPYQFVPSLALDAPPAIEQVQAESCMIGLAWDGGNVSTQVIQRSTMLESNTWQTIATNPPTPALTRTGVDTNPPPGHAAYRISIE